MIRVHGGTQRVPEPETVQKVSDLSDFTLKFSSTVPDSIYGYSKPDDQPRVQMSCGHYVDPNTLTQYCRSLLHAENYEFKCPAIVDKKVKKCVKIWDYAEVRKKAVLNDAECCYYETKMSEYAASTYCEMKECPWCRSFIEREDLTNLRVICAICKQKGKNDFCWQCLKEWSGPVKSSEKCGASNCEHRDLPSIRDCGMITLKEVGITVPLRRACPTCGRVVEHKGEGCKNIICPRCKKEFCFACLELTEECLRLKPSSWYKECKKPIAPKQTKIPIWSRK